MSNFINDCINGDALISNIDDYIEEWHKNKTLNMPIYTFLGMSLQEYKLFLENESFLASIITAHKNDETLESELNA